MIGGCICMGGWVMRIQAQHAYCDARCHAHRTAPPVMSPSPTSTLTSTCLCLHPRRRPCANLAAQRPSTPSPASTCFPSLQCSQLASSSTSSRSAGRAQWQSRQTSSTVRLPRPLHPLTTVLHGPLQPHTRPGDREHPTGFFRDGFCWGSDDDPGKHYVGGVVTKEFLDYSKSRGEQHLRREHGVKRGASDGRPSPTGAARIAVGLVIPECPRTRQPARTLLGASSSLPALLGAPRARGICERNTDL